MSKVTLIIQTARHGLVSSETSLDCTKIFMRAIYELGEIQPKENAIELNNAFIELKKLMSSQEVMIKYSDPGILSGIKDHILRRYHNVVLEAIKANAPRKSADGNNAKNLEPKCNSKASKGDTVSLQPKIHEDVEISRRLALGIPKRSAAATKRQLFTPQRFDIPDSKANYYDETKDNKRLKLRN